MSFNEKKSRNSKYSQRQYQNSSVYNKSVKSQFTSLSVQLPKNYRKYNNIQKQLLEKQSKTIPVTINLTNTKYPILTEVCGVQGFNWRVQNFAQSKVWNIKWCDSGVTNQLLQRMTHQQKINHFPNMHIIARKNSLASTLATMKEQFPHQFDFLPRTFLYPNDYAKIRHYFVESRKRALVKTFIVKPEAGCQGRGIYITQNPTDFQKEQKCVIQKYISNPLLYQGLKFDLRIYVLVSSCNPLRIYLYNQGLVRFATEPYELPQTKNLSNFFIHLTNYAINKSNPNYQYNYTVKDMSYGHKKSLAQFFKTLKDMGYKANSYWSQIKDNIIKTMIAAQPFLVSNYKSCRPQQHTFNMCFEVLGFDFIIDNQDRVFLLEVNHTPSFAADTPLDHIIKKNLLKDTLLMVTPSQQEINIKEKLERIKQRQKYVKFKNSSQNAIQQKEKLLKQLNQLRTKQELQFRGTYEMIYPCKNQHKMDKYIEYLSYAAKVVQHNPQLIAANMPSASDIRNRLKENPKAKVVSKHLIKENMTRNNTEVSTSKRNLIYSYGYVKKDSQPLSKRNLVTLPAQPVRVEVHPKERQKFISNRMIRASSKERMKGQSSQSLQKEVEKPQPTNLRYGRSQQKKKESDHIVRRQAGYRVSGSNKSSPAGRQISSFSNRIRAYKTPLMF